MGQPALRHAGGDQPLEVPVLAVQLGRGYLELAFPVGRPRERPGLDAVLILAGCLHGAPPEEVEAGPGDGPAGAGVGHEVIALAVEPLFHDDRVVEPDHDAAGVAPFHLRCEQIGASFLKRCRDADPPVEMSRPRFQVQVPPSDRAPQILFLIQHHQARADVADIKLLPVELFGPRADVFLDVVEQLRVEDFVRLEVDSLAVAEEEIDGCAGACRAGHEGLELAPGTDDLIDVFFLAVIWVVVDLDGSLQVLNTPVELQAVFEDGGEHVESDASLPVGVVGDCLVILDRVKLIGKLEPFDAGSQPGDGLIVFQRVQSVRRRTSPPRVPRSGPERHGR